MKNFILAALLSVPALAGVAQQKTFLIMGKVIDSASGLPLNGASAYCQNTTYGTTSNTEGGFALRLPVGGYDLVVSYTGYDKKSIRISNTQLLNDTLVITLPQIDKTLAEVAIVATNEVEDGLVRFGKFFSDNFIGTTPNASQCTIDNPQALHFFYTKNKKRHRLKVTSTEDLLVRNSALGYIIRYQLDSFSYDYNSNISQYTGYPFFIEIDTTPEVKEQWIKSRARTYLGSRMHFMKSLFDSSVTREGFIVEKMDPSGSKGTEIPDLYDSSLYSLDSNVVSVGWDGRYRVTYKRVMPDKKFLEEFKLPASSRAQVTLLDVNDGFAVEQNGYFYEQYDVISTGYWGWKKLAELLPYDYVYQ
jgi:hypothetical protein